MKIHIFNPEHDIALASNLENFTAPHAGRCLRHDLGFLPALWASRGDCVLVDDIDAAKEGLRRIGLKTDAVIMDSAMLARFVATLKDDVEIVPWGWDVALRHYLARLGIAQSSMPTKAEIDTLRSCSHRGWAAEHLLPILTKAKGTIGEAIELRSLDEVQSYFSSHHSVVLKAPWSSSGRGVRYVTENEGGNLSLHPQLCGWINNTIKQQGCIMAEPYYNKVLDFGMEFTSEGNGTVAYKGLSLFHTLNAAYVGNLIESEEYKEDLLSRYISPRILHSVRNVIIETLGDRFRLSTGSAYRGAFGIDMMVVRRGEKLLLHPCVELNLRMTMGHVALELGKRGQFEGYVMRISCSNQYRMRLEPMQTPSVSVEPCHSSEY